MLSFPGSLKVFLCRKPCDMRKGFEGLTALVAERLNEDLRSGGHGVAAGLCIKLFKDIVHASQHAFDHALDLACRDAGVECDPRV